MLRKVPSERAAAAQSLGPSLGPVSLPCLRPRLVFVPRGTCRRSPSRLRGASAGPTLLTVARRRFPELGVLSDSGNTSLPDRCARRTRQRSLGAPGGPSVSYRSVRRRDVFSLGEIQAISASFSSCRFSLCFINSLGSTCKHFPASPGRFVILVLAPV